MQEIKYKILHSKGRLPTEEVDSTLYSLHSGERCVILPNERKIINCFLELEIPQGFLGYIFTSKDLYLKNGITICNEIIFPGKKELQLILTNANMAKAKIMMSDYEKIVGEKGKIDIYIGDKIANFILIPQTKYSFIENEN